MELFGEFKYEEKHDIYKCNITRVISWKVDEKVLRTVGDHQKDKTNDNLSAISFNNIRIDHFPRRLEMFFPNLRTLTINSCGLQSIRKFDLIGLENLKQLTLNGNEISALPDNLFEATPNIETLSFYSNRIRFIGMNIFNPLSKLKYANFKMNVNIDVCFKTVGNGVTLDEMKRIIEANCQPKFEGQIENFFDDLKLVYI